MMKRLPVSSAFLTSLLTLLAVVTGLGQPESPKAHPGFVGRLASPEIVVGLREQLGLSREQVDRIHRLHENFVLDKALAETEGK